MKDATGEEIILGGKYGYSQSNNGTTEIVHCIAEKFNELSVTVRPFKRMRTVYSDDLKPVELQNKPHRATAVKPFILFPIIKVKSEFTMPLGDVVNKD